MPIDVTCGCGKAMRVKNQAAGKRVRCPKCDELVRVPLAGAFDHLIISEEPPATASLDRRPFWKDPVVVFGSLVPLVVIVWFVGYLLSERYQSQVRDQIRALKAQADQQVAVGDLKEAFNGYSQILSLAEQLQRHEAEYDQITREAKAERARIEPTVREQIAREEAARKASLAKEEAERKVREEAEQRKAEIKAEEERRLAEEERLAQFSADVSGGAWVIKKSGQSDILRGLKIYLLRERIPKKEIESALMDAARLIADRFEEASDAADQGGQTLSLLSDQASASLNAAIALRWVGSESPERIDAIQVLSLARMALGYDKLDGRQDLQAIAILESDLWEHALPAFTVDEAVTNIDGKYKFSKVQGGKYYLYAVESSAYNLIEWAIPVTVDSNEPVEKDLFNETAITILNKSN